MAVRPILPATVFTGTVSGSATKKATTFFLGQMFSAQAAWLISVGAGLTATFKIMVSMDGTNFYDSGQVLPSVSGSAANLVAQYSGAFPYVSLWVYPSAGSASVTITGSAKGGA